jgi:hypothetical protein
MTECDPARRVVPMRRSANLAGRPMNRVDAAMQPQLNAGGWEKPLGTARSVRALSLICWSVALGGLCATAVGQRAVQGALVNVRDAFLTKYTPDTGALYASPDRLIEAGFKVDPPSIVEEWRGNVQHVPAIRAAWPGIVRGDELTRGRALAGLFRAENDHGPDTCGGLPDLTELLSFLTAGGLACCSDYTRAFLAVASSVGLQAREVRVSVPHGVVEVYLPSSMRWVMIDPLFAMMARAADRQYLSVLELQAAVRAGRPVKYEFLARDPVTARPDRDRAVFDAIYGPALAQAELSVPMGNNVISYDRFRLPMRALPKAVVQMFSIVAGIRPRIIALSAAQGGQRALRLEVLRWGVLGAAMLAGSGMVLGPALALLRWLQRARLRT